MKISKIAIAVALSTGFLFGCNSDGLPIPPETSVEPGTPASALNGGLWQIGSATAISAFSNVVSTDLPNIYIFADGTQKYYFDDTVSGTYEIKTTTYTEDVDSKTIIFTYYGTDTSTSTNVSGAYSVTNGTLSVDTASEGILTGSDETGNPSVSDAVTRANEESGINNQVQIVDTLTTDTGELRLKLSDNDITNITSGKLTVDLIYQADEDSIGDSNSKNAYVSFYTTGTSTTNLHGEIALEGGVIKYRDNAKALNPIDGSYVEGETLKIDVTWDTNVFTFKVNDAEYSYLADEIPENSPVEIIALRLGDNGSTNNYELIADNLKIYSSDSGIETLVFEDSFDGYSAGKVLNSKPYNNNSSEATVIGSDNIPTDPTDPTDNKVAAITDQDTSDTGELRYKFDSGMTTGTHKLSMYYDINETESAYVSLFDTKNSTSSLIGELKIDEGKITLRGEAEQVATFTPDTWIDIEMSWDTSSTTEVGTYSVKIDGTEYGPYHSQNITPGVEVTATTVKFSSNSDMANTTLFVDNYEVYSDDSGTIEVFNDDFDARTIGEDLSTSPYNSSTFSAVVAQDPLNTAK